MRNFDNTIFSDISFSEERINENLSVVSAFDVDKSFLSLVEKYLERNGFARIEDRNADERYYSAYKKDDIGIFINYYANIREMRIVEEYECRYFSYDDKVGANIVSPQITQVTLEDFGMSYVIRLSDGRFIVIDGGRNFEPDADRLYKCLVDGVVHKKPVIAAWVMSHPHSDHFHCFMGFMDKYSDRVIIEKFMFNFPEHDDLKHYPKLAQKDDRFETDTSEMTNIPIMLHWINRIGASIYTPQTGQTYFIGDARLEILSCICDTIGTSDTINSTSLVIRMELGGQVILWSTDASYSIAKLPERYGDYLKADILQVPHHGFQCGSATAEIEGYELISPRICFIPVSDFNAYTIFCTFRDGTRHLMNSMDIDEIITGTDQRTITLPYIAPAYAKQQYKYNYATGVDNCGARTWIFTELSTSRKEDFVFTILNTTIRPANVFAELFFEDHHRDIKFIKIEVKGVRQRKVCIIGDEVDSESLYFNWLSLKKQGIPENADFSIRFVSDVPVVISHKDHAATYHSTIN